MKPAVTAQQLVDAVYRDFPDHRAGGRPVHTFGVGVRGVFVASRIARQYCVAEHFQGQNVDVTVRFSNGMGTATPHDGWSDVRGMATRFHLQGGAATDLVAMTLAEFFSPTTEDFLAFCKAAEPAPVAVESPWRKLLDMLQLKQPLADPEPGKTQDGSAGTLAYANQHRHAQQAVFDSSTIGAPLSYARATYHAVHTFMVTAPDGTRRPVRFSWQPAAGVATLGAEALQPENYVRLGLDEYLKQELQQRLDNWEAKFVLMMMIGESGDALDDPTQRWPAKRPRIVMGTLWIRQLAEDQQADGEKISFNPCRLVHGIEVSNDPILQARREAYEVSRQMRGGTYCPFNHES